MMSCHDASAIRLRRRRFIFTSGRGNKVHIFIAVPAGFCRYLQRLAQIFLFGPRLRMSTTVAEENEKLKLANANLLKQIEQLSVRLSAGTSGCSFCVFP